MMCRARKYARQGGRIFTSEDIEDLRRATEGFSRPSKQRFHRKYLRYLDSFKCTYTTKHGEHVSGLEKDVQHLLHSVESSNRN